jgi:DnaK suppressor protein
MAEAYKLGYPEIPYSEFSSRLLKRREEIIGRDQAARANLDEQIMTAPGDAADESVIDTSADYFLSLANQHQQELLEIHDALNRLQRGVYGECENCEEPISIERLRSLPTARHCVSCQAARERQTPNLRISKF